MVCAMIEVNAGDIVTLEIAKVRQRGTAMTGVVNGLVLVTVHDVFTPAWDGGAIYDKNVLPVVAVRVDAIISVAACSRPRRDGVVGMVMTDWQGEKR